MTQLEYMVGDKLDQKGKTGPILSRSGMSETLWHPCNIHTMSMTYISRWAANASSNDRRVRKGFVGPKELCLEFSCLKVFVFVCKN